MVWLPTADAHTQDSANLPRLCLQEPRIGTHTYAIPPVNPLVTEAIDTVLALIAEHDAVLATGHLSGDECHWLSNRARHYGIDRLLYTHPSYTVPGLNPSAIRALVENGGYAEITTYQLLHQPGCTASMLARAAEAAGKRLILSSDAGQPNSPPPPEAMMLLIDALAAEGLDRKWLEAAASTTPTSLFAPA